MRTNDLTEPKPTSRLDKRQGPKRREILGGAVTEDERTEILLALDQAGFASISEGVREILLAFKDSGAVRDAVADWRRRAA